MILHHAPLRKISEGLVEVIEELLSDEFNRMFSARLGHLLSREAFRRFLERVDYSGYGGAPLLGVGGSVLSVTVTHRQRLCVTRLKWLIALRTKTSLERLLKRFQQILFFRYDGAFMRFSVVYHVSKNNES